MAYETGSSSGVNDLLQKLSTFLTAQGWTINKDATEGSGRWLSVQKGSGLFLNFLSDPATTGTTNPGPWIHLRGATGYDGGEGFTTQPGVQPQHTTCNKLTGSFSNYWFFEGDDYIHVVIEIEAGRFRHLQGGLLDKTSTFTGGIYTMGTTPNITSNQQSDPTILSHTFPWASGTSSSNARNYVYADVGDGAQWYSSYQSDTYRHAGMWRENSSTSNSQPYRVGYLRRLLDATPSAVNGLPVLEAPRAMPRRATELYPILGTPKDLRLCSVKNHAPATVLTIGADEWLMFPWTARSATTGGVSDEQSGYYGLAYRKNTS